MRLEAPEFRSPGVAGCENQIPFAFMSEAHLPSPRIGLSAGAGDGGIQTEQSLLPTVAAVGIAGALALGVLASYAVEPLLLTLLSCLAMVGTFMVFGLLAGHVRIGPRVSEHELLHSLIDGLDDGVLVAHKDGTPVLANRALVEMVGLTGSGDVRSLDMMFGSSPQASAAMFRLKRALERGEPWCEEIDIASGDGAELRRWRVGHRPCAVPGHESDVQNLVLWSIADVTVETARHVQEIHGLEAALQRLEMAPAGFMEVDGQGVVRRLNATFAGWLGLEQAAIQRRGLVLTDLLAQQDLDLLLSEAAQPQPTGASIDANLLGETGSYVALRLFVRRDTGGGLLISAFPRLEADEGDAATAAGVRFARFFQMAPFGMASVNGSGDVVASNAAFQRMAPSASGTKVVTAVEALCGASNAETARAVENAIRQAAQGVITSSPVEITGDGEADFSRRLYVAPIARGAGAGGEVAVLYLLDATEQKALEARFAQSSKMEAVGKLAGGIAHDFNNVLTAIIGFSDLLLQTHRPSDPAYRDINNIRSSATRAAGLVAKLLAFSRRQTLQVEAMLLGEELTEWKPVLNRSLGERIELKISTGRDLWYVRTDRTQLEHALLNLANNARDAMPDGGSLSISSRNISERDCQRLGHHGMRDGEYVLIEVADTGSGMPPEVLRKIFEPFFTTKGVGRGTGLGLATVYGIVKQSGGYIFPESEVGQGTTFRIYLPRYLPENDEQLAPPKGGKKEKEGDLTGAGRVLLVEDEDVVRSFAVRALKRQGYEVLEASSGVEALEVMKAHEDRVDIVVSDVVMPEMDGPTLLKELRKKNPDMKIIFVSGYPHEAFETSLDPTEEFAFLPKPFSLPQLAAKVKEQLGQS